MMNFDMFKKVATVEMLKALDKELEVIFERCFLDSFYLEPSYDNATNQFVANFKNGDSYSYMVGFETLVKVFTAESFGKAFNMYIRPLQFEKL